MDGITIYGQYKLHLLLLTCLLALLANPAAATSLNVSPLRLELSSSTPTSFLKLTNDDKTARVVQVELMAWSQKRQRNVFLPSDDIVVNPPIFTVAPGKTQIVRVGLRQPPTADHELAYRLFMTEVPQPQPAAPQTSQMRVVLRLSVPVFVSTQIAAAPALRWTAASDKDNTLQITATNTGNVHYQIRSFEVADSERSQVLAKESPGVYILPGRSWHWRLKAKTHWQADLFHLSAHTDLGDIDEDIRPH